MGRRCEVRQPSAAEVQQLQGWLDDSLLPFEERRVQAILLHGEGVSATEIAQILDVHVNTIYADLHAFGRSGLTAVHRRGRRGAPPRIDEEAVSQICQIADRAPAELGLIWGRWTLQSLREYLLRTHVVVAISREHLRRLLKKGACATARSSAN